MGPLELFVPNPSQLTMEAEEEVGKGRWVVLLTEITFISLSVTEREHTCPRVLYRVTHNQTHIV